MTGVDTTRIRGAIVATELLIAAFVVSTAAAASSFLPKFCASLMCYLVVMIDAFIWPEYNYFVQYTKL